MLTSKERITRQARGQDVDRVPTLGGWIGGARILASIAGITIDEYLADPEAGVIRAHLALGVDGMIQPIVPRSAEQVRTGHVLDEAFADVEPEALVRRAAELPDNERQLLATFDRAAEEQRYRRYLENALANWRGIVPIPNFWEIGGHFPLYSEFGYTAFLSACALYPQAVGHIWSAKSLHSRERARILAGLYRELDLVPLMFCGEDLCNNQGPMVSPAFLREHYFPTVRMIIQPLLDEGVRLVHHCDGDVRPLIGDFLDLGFSGFQGFQYEVGIDLAELHTMQSRAGEPVLLWPGLSVSRTLPFGTPDDVRAEVDYFLDATDGGRGMFLITSNVTGVEVPPENLVAGYRHAHTSRSSNRRSRPRAQEWPGHRLVSAEASAS
jgi:uroporphyrinogen decarboxylase